MNKWVKKLIIFLSIVIGYFIVTASIYIPFVVSDAKMPHNDSCDYLMILGNQVVGEDTPSPLMLERIGKATEYLKENTDCKVIVCGGITTDVQKITEAELMKKLLVEGGISPKRIILEDRSTTTFENFEFAKTIIEIHSGKEIKNVKVAFLSSDYHIHRATLIAEHFGFENIGKVSCTTEKGFIKAVVREYFVAYDLFIKTVLS